MDVVSLVEVPASQMSPVCFKFTNTNHHKVNAHEVKISKSFFKVKIHLKKVSLMFGRGLVMCVYIYVHRTRACYLVSSLVLNLL